MVIVVIGFAFLKPALTKAQTATQTALAGLEFKIEKKAFAFRSGTSSASVLLDTAMAWPISAVKLTVPASVLNYLAFSYGQKCLVDFGLQTAVLTAPEKASSSLSKFNNKIFFSPQSVQPFLIASGTVVNFLPQPLWLSFYLPASTSLENLIIAKWQPEKKRWQTVSSIIEGSKISAYVLPGQKIILLQSSQTDLAGVKAIRGVKVLGLARGLRDIELEQIKFDAAQIVNRRWTQILDSLSLPLAPAKQDYYLEHYTELLALGFNLSKAEISSLNFFITYGTKTTYSLGAGERAGVLLSYRRAFSHLPQTESDWVELIKIARGRWPSIYSPTAEAQARKIFFLIYQRQPSRQNSADQSAIKLMAYGLRPWPRRLDAEKRAVSIFNNIFQHQPLSSADWDIVRAIAYSGAER